ncbi:secreted RxLR effector protein 161-like [Leptopilina heterotoma]|uniref:secreted RxLR effector protein 161-like n=1 Tax=Leptopilina heterotoma TaxID=63436 RepID=UPI001CA9104F|nr:secreted RxLR effector protein 161-like [Leptopilina heterotoma]
MDLSVKLSEIENEPEEAAQKSFPYREAVGCLNYIATISRPDISFTVNALARQSNNPTEQHWRAVKKVMRYLKGTLNFSLVYKGNDQGQFHGYSDSDYAGDLSERKSTSGYVFVFQDGPIAWSSILQRITALSSSEAE